MKSSLSEFVAMATEDVKWQILRGVQLMKTLAKEFLKPQPHSPELETIWKTMMLMSSFRQIDREALRELHQDPKNDQFFHAYVKFQIYQSEKYNGSLWPGGLKGYPTSLSDELKIRKFKENTIWTKEIYQDYEDLLDGK